LLTAATILGSGGFVPTGRRETSCLLLLPADSDTAIVVDAGTGLRRLVTDPVLLDGRRRLVILLTHFHIDHTAGLAYLAELREMEISVLGPGQALYGQPTTDVLQRIFSPPVMPIGLSHMGATVDELAPGDTTIAGVPVAVRAQERHPDPTLGLRFGDAITWCTDTEGDPGTVDFAHGARVLCHDAWGPPAAPGHAEPADAARVASTAQVPVLVLIHVPPNADEPDMQRRASEHHDAVYVATDGLQLLAL
jgi:ribonuclease BN (tRNA processing enzyme)